MAWWQQGRFNQARRYRPTSNPDCFTASLARLPKHQPPKGASSPGQRVPVKLPGAQVLDEDVVAPHPRQQAAAVRGQQGKCRCVVSWRDRAIGCCHSARIGGRPQHWAPWQLQAMRPSLRSKRLRTAALPPSRPSSRPHCGCWAPAIQAQLPTAPPDPGQVEGRPPGGALGLKPKVVPHNAHLLVGAACGRKVQH